MIDINKEMALLTCLDAWGDTLGPIKDYCNISMLLAIAGVNKRCLDMIQVHFKKMREKHKHPSDSLKIKKVYIDCNNWHYDLSSLNVESAKSKLSDCLIRVSCYKRYGMSNDYSKPKIVVIRAVSIRNNGLGTRLYAWVLTHRTYSSSGAYPDWFSLNNSSMMPTATLLEIIPWR